MSRIAKAAAVAVGTGAVVLSGAGLAMADAGAQGAAANSPGVLSGNLIQVPVHVPVNVCGNTVNVIGALNPAFGNTCANGDEGDKGDGGYGG
ncbi:chaplin [Streptomyces sp. NPDC002795]|uniref:chaplin n=1 Tax=Streptomyces sp. NPDC002795 TaxID=3364665 RepID=UPI003697B1F1